MFDDEKKKKEHNNTIEKENRATYKIIKTPRTAEYKHGRIASLENHCLVVLGRVGSVGVV
jgi:hypothetical protein